MRCTPIITGLVLSFATASTQAQVSIDMSKITCDEYVHDRIPTSDFISFSAVVPLPWEMRSNLSRWLIANWLSGYYHELRDALRTLAAAGHGAHRIWSQAAFLPNETGEELDRQLVLRCHRLDQWAKRLR